MPCTSYVVQSGDTCIAIATSSGTSFQQIVAWNPTLNSYCTNLIAGQNICVGPPGGYGNFSTISGATVTQTAQYATTTASRPTPVASGTTLDCGRYYLVQPGDYCQLVSVNMSISLGLFEAINPSIDQACDNLLSGFNYCVMPTENWNSTSTVVSAPTTVPTGTTTECYRYYVIQSGDYCALVESDFDITFDQLQTWNPSLLDDCSNLELGEAYCVSAPYTTAKRYARPALQVLTSGTSGIYAVPTSTDTAAFTRTTSGSCVGGVPVGWPGIKSRAL